MVKDARFLMTLGRVRKQLPELEAGLGALTKSAGFFTNTLKKQSVDFFGVQKLLNNHMKDAIGLNKKAEAVLTDATWIVRNGARFLQPHRKIGLGQKAPPHDSIGDVRAMVIRVERQQKLLDNALRRLAPEVKRIANDPGRYGDGAAGSMQQATSAMISFVEFLVKLSGSIKKKAGNAKRAK